MADPREIMKLHRILRPDDGKLIKCIANPVKSQYPADLPVQIGRSAGRSSHLYRGNLGWPLREALRLFELGVASRTLATNIQPRRVWRYWCDVIQRKRCEKVGGVSRREDTERAPRRIGYWRGVRVMRLSLAGLSAAETHDCGEGLAQVRRWWCQFGSMKFWLLLAKLPQLY